MVPHNFFTLPASQRANHGADISGSGKPAGHPGQNIAFFDLIYTQTQKTGKDGQASEIANFLQTEKADSEKKQDPASVLLKALANSRHTLEEISKLENSTLTDEQLLTIQPPGLNNENPGQKSLALADNPDLLQALTELHALLQKLQALFESGNSALTDINLTPKQVALLKAKLEKILANGEVASIETDALDLIPPQNIQETGQDESVQEEALQAILNSLASFLSSKAQQESGDDNTEQTHLGAPGHADPGKGNSLFGRLNALLSRIAGIQAGNAENTQGQTQHSPAKFAGDFNPLEESAEKTLEKIAKNLSQKSNAHEPGLQKNADKTPQIAQQLANTGFLKVLPPGLTSGLFSEFEFSPALMEELGLQLSSFSAGHSGALSSLITQSQGPGHAHPATQMVAMQIQKMASGGESKNITLQLDPPDLGRVEVKMSFDKNSKIKAILTAEKPETYMMLQRDSHILERALQGAGLEIDSDGGLSFELAAEDHDFDQNGKHDGSGGSDNKKGEGEDSPDELIESTMTWQVDPETGHVHYSILA